MNGYCPIRLFWDVNDGRLLVCQASRAPCETSLEQDSTEVFVTIRAQFPQLFLIIIFLTGLQLAIFVAIGLTVYTFIDVLDVVGCNFFYCAVHPYCTVSS